MALSTNVDTDAKVEIDLLDFCVFNSCATDWNYTDHVRTVNSGAAIGRESVYFDMSTKAI